MPVYVKTDELKEMLDFLNMSQQALADESGVGKDSISLYLSHQRSPSPETRSKIMAALGLEGFQDWRKIFKSVRSKKKTK